MTASITKPAAWTWPEWARKARIAGAYFDPTDQDAAIDAQLAALAGQHVSVVLADSPWGQHYDVWVDAAKFRAVKELVARVASRAHARGLKVVLYQTGLELLSDPGRNPGLEHPEWAQLSLAGSPVLFDDVTSDQQHWVSEGIWDFWLSPCSTGPERPNMFQQLCHSRVQEMAGTGIDGLWVDEVYLQSGVGGHHNLWPSADVCSADAFRAATGLSLPGEANWGDPIFRRWVVWRHSQISDFLLAEKQAARGIAPDLVFFNENSAVDTARSTYAANDPAACRAHYDMSTGHEVEVIGFRMDQGQMGMTTASLDDWLSFRTMIAFARGADRGKPSWILTYGYEPRDSAQLAGVVLAEGGNFYETRAPQMAVTVEAAHRTRLFRWIADHEAAWYESDSLAEVGLLYSPRTRDLVDTCSGEPYDAKDSTHFAAYRASANLLYRAHIPFEVVIDTDTAAFSRYRVLIVPEVRAMSEDTAAGLRSFNGLLITVGQSGRYDEWLTQRSITALAGVAQRHVARIKARVIASADTGLLAVDAPASVQCGLRWSQDGYSVAIVNTAQTLTAPFTLKLRLRPGETVTGARFVRYDDGAVEASIGFQVEGERVKLGVPGGIDTLALLTLSTRCKM